MAIRTAPKAQPAIERALPVEKPTADRLVDEFGHLTGRAKINPSTDEAPKFNKTAYQREYMRKRRAGEAKTVRISIETDIVDAFKATGPGWQARLNTALRSVKPA